MSVDSSASEMPRVAPNTWRTMLKRGSSSASEQSAPGAMLSTIRRQSSEVLSMLKPSELKKLRAEAAAARRLTESHHTSARSDNDTHPPAGVAGSVLAQIAEMREQLEQKTTEARVARERQEQALREVLDELLSTEANYVADLRHTCSTYMAPLAALLDGEVHSKVFSNLGQISMMHSQVEAELGSIRSQMPLDDVVRRVLAAFLKLLPFFKMYSVYCSSYTNLATAIASARQLKAAAELIDTAVGPPLQALLFRPVQRMCVYPLLFKQALKCAAEGEQSARFAEAFDALQAIISQVNENVRRQEEQLRAANVLLSEVGGEAAALLSAARTLTLEAAVDMKIADGSSILEPTWMVRKAYKLYVFSDTIMVCVRNKLSVGYRKKLLLPLDELTISEGRHSSQSFTPTSASSRTERFTSILEPSASLPARRSSAGRRR